MKELKDFINEALLVEGNTDYAFVWSHNDPETLYCLNGATNKLQKDLKNYDYNIQMVKIKSNICSIMWNDESLICRECKGNNLNDVEKEALKDIKSQMTNPGNEDDTYKCFDCCLGSGEWYDDNGNYTAQQYVHLYLDMIKDSEVDGDSGFGRAIIDIKNSKVLLSGIVEVIFQTADDFLESITQE